MSLLWTRFKSDWFSLKEALHTLFCYRSFLKIDLYLLALYFFKSPYRIIKKVAPEEIYGETPLSTMELILREMAISKEDTLVEVGSGRGKALLFAHFTTGCHAVGIEKVKPFTLRLKEVIKRFKIERVKVIEGDFLEASYDEATAIYFYGVSFSEEAVSALIEKWKSAPHLQRIVTISEPLKAFDVVRTFKVRFPWGETDAFLQVKGGS